MWQDVELIPDPLAGQLQKSHHDQSSHLVKARISLKALLEQAEIAQASIEQEGLTARIALADFVARHLATSLPTHAQRQSPHVEMLDVAVQNQRARRKKSKRSQSMTPFVLERTDVWCSADHQLHITLRLWLSAASASASATTTIGMDEDKTGAALQMEAHPSRLETMNPAQVLEGVRVILNKLASTNDASFCKQLLQHVACVVFQERMRSQLESMDAVAFLADGSILPRKTGASQAPMLSPPAIPFEAPSDSSMSTSMSVPMCELFQHHLPEALYTMQSDNGKQQQQQQQQQRSAITVHGMIIPRGVTLIVGGGYHGKSTILQAIASSVFPKIPGDGREYCVAVRSATCIRAEDGRSVHNCNISAFISNLPNSMDTRHFTSSDCSGSTSQAANVTEAIEMGVSAMLVDEDVSAANFMARDGRMRALVMEESITPLLYRVNGLYDTHGISTIVVVGGVGDWLDVPHHVILMNKYVASDATLKAQSISRQFSYGHVQYGGRGVVHRLHWQGTPAPRCVTRRYLDSAGKLGFALMENGHGIVLDIVHDGMDVSSDDGKDGNGGGADDDDEEDGTIDVSKLQQLLGKKQLFGCGICVLWILQAASQQTKEMGVRELLQLLEQTIDERGMVAILQDISHGDSHQSAMLFESVGYASRPRIYEVGQALNRIRGIEMKTLPMPIDPVTLKAEQEAERRKKKLAEIWANRRKK